MLEKVCWVHRFSFVLIALIWLGACSEDPVAQRDEYFRSAQEYVQQQKYREAIIQYLNALKADPKYVPARMALAETYEKIGNLAAAVAEYRRIVDENPDNVPARLRLGHYYLAAGIQERQWFDEAKKLAQEVLALDPDNVEAKVLLGNALAGQQDFEASVRAFREALEKDPQNLDAYLNLGATQFAQEQRAEAEKTFLEAVERHPDDPKAHLGLGNFYAFAGEWDKAEAAFRKAFDLDKTDSRSILAMVRLYLARQNPEAALAVMREAIEVSPDPVPLQLGYVGLLAAQGRGEEARSLLETLYRENPERREIGLRLAEFYLAEKNLAAAGEIAKALLEADQRDAEAMFLQARIAVLEEQYDDGLKLINAALEINPSFTPALLAKADLLQRRGRLIEAEETVRKVLEFDRTNLGARARLAKYQALLKRNRSEVENALAEAEGILQVLPNQSDALAARAEALLALERLDAAAAAFEDLQRRSPDNPYYVHRLGTIAALRKQTDVAVHWLRKALEVNPAFPDVLNDLMVTLAQAGRYDDAIRELNEWQAKAPEDTHWMFALLKGKVQLRAGRLDAAEQEFRRAVALNPENYEAYLQLGQLQAARGRQSEAVAEVDRLLEKDANFGPAHLLRAYFSDAAGNQPAAIEGYRKCLEVFPEGDPAWAVAANNLAWLLASRGENLTEALSLAQRARRIDPENPSYADTLGWIHYLMGNYILAVDQLEFAVNHGKQGPQHYYRLGLAYHKKGDAMRAKQALRRALELSDSFEGAAEAKRILQELG